MEMQKHLLYLTKIAVSEIPSAKIRGVAAEWKEGINTASISFFFDGEVSEDELEDASVACTEIIAHIPNGLLEENFIRCDYPNPLPKNNFWAYKPNF
jgi:hypothetical protein